jgi:glycerol-3-phosphate dehydrogenase
LDKIYDFIVIGAGVVGNAVARELSKYYLGDSNKVNIAVLEKELDVVCETSGRNSGVLHAGFNNKPGSKMAKFCVEGCLEFDQIAKELDVEFIRTGKVVVGFDDDDMKQLLKTKEQGEANGCVGLEIINKERLLELAPNVGGEFALYSPMTGIMDPFEYTIALAENAHSNGVEYFFGDAVVDINRENDLYIVKTEKNEYMTKWIINCAGLNSDKISTMLGIDEYKIYPCRGEYIIMDKMMGEYLNIPVYPVINPKIGGLGIHLTPSVDGNVFIGPSATYLDCCDDYAATKPVIDMLLDEGKKLLPAIKREYFIRNFSGIRPKLTRKGGFADFVIEARAEVPNTVNLVGIESPGLTSATPIGREVVRLIKEKTKLKENPKFNPIRKGHVVFRKQPLEVQKELIEKDPNYGEIVCRCETITKAEVLNAINNPLGVDTITGIKYRCRSMMGRCQGGYCQTRVTELIQEVKNKKREEVLYNRKGSYMFAGKVRG